MIYLDNAATTEPKFFRKDYLNYWFNSNMPYAYNEQSKVQEAEDKVKKCLGVKGGHVVTGSPSSGLVQDLFNKIKENT